MLFYVKYRIYNISSIQNILILHCQVCPLTICLFISIPYISYLVIYDISRDNIYECNSLVSWRLSSQYNGKAIEHRLHGIYASEIPVPLRVVCDIYRSVLYWIAPGVYTKTFTKLDVSVSLLLLRDNYTIKSVIYLYVIHVYVIYIQLFSCFQPQVKAFIFLFTQCCLKLIDIFMYEMKKTFSTQYF